MIDKAHLRLIAVTDRRAMGEGWMETLKNALEGGVTAVWLREKDLDAARLYPLATALRALTRRHEAALIVGDRVDVALAAEADAAHLGWTSLPVEAARRAVGGRCSLGFSAHNLEEARRAVEQGADYLIYGPVFPTPSKEGLVPVVGLEGLREAASALSVPVVALGGITEDNAPACLAAGAAGVAAIRSLLCVEDARSATGRMARQVGLSGGGKP